MELNGVLAPLPTPLTDDGSTVSEIRLLRLLRKLEPAGLSGYLACGEVGEFTSVGFSERKALVEILLRNVAATPQVVVNVSTLSTTASLDLAQHAARHGAKACVVMPPFYGELTDEEVLSFFKVIGQYAGLPVIAVDPRRRLTEPMRDDLAGSSGVFLATPNLWMAHAFGADSLSTVDDFALEPGASATLSLFKPVGRLLDQPEDDLENLTRFIVQNGSARVAKAAFEALGIDLGPLRGPQHPLPPARQELLKLWLEFE